MKLFLLAALTVLVFEAHAFSGFSKDGPEEIAKNVDVIYSRNVTHVLYLPLHDLPWLLTHKDFDPTIPTAVYVHGWMESGRMDLSVLAVRGAYLDRGDHNVVTIDWDHYSKNVNYHVSVIPQLKVIAETIAQAIYSLVLNGLDINYMHLVGHSLGGQMVGKIGRHLKFLSKGTVSVPRIYALDPAGPGFEDMNIDGFGGITRSDGDFVQIIHTNGGVLGMKHRVGNLDFYPNGGSSHPGCDVDAVSTNVKSFSNVCNHARSWHFYQLSVRNPKAFPAIRCESWDDFVSGSTNCFSGDIEYMGFGANVNATGKYFLQTHSNMFNLSRGMDGARHRAVVPKRLLIPVNEGYKPDETIPDEVMNDVYY